MKINYLIVLVITLFAFPVFGQSNSNATKENNLIYKLIDKQDTKELQKQIDEKGAKFFDANADNAYLKYAMDSCKVLVVQLFTKNKVTLAENEEQIAEIVEYYIENLGCSFSTEKDTTLEKTSNKQCLIPIFIALLENDYMVLKPTLLGRLNCYWEVPSEWYLSIQPIVKALLKKGVKVEDAFINITGQKDNYLLELCKLEKRNTEQEKEGKEGKEEDKAAIRNYILFLKEQGVNFKKKINQTKPIDLLSEEFQKKIK